MSLGILAAIAGALLLLGASLYRMHAGRRVEQLERAKDSCWAQVRESEQLRYPQGGSAGFRDPEFVDFCRQDSARHAAAEKRMRWVSIGLAVAGTTLTIAGLLMV